MLFLAGAACGLGVATLVLPFAARFVLGLSMPGIVVLAGIAVGLLVAFVSAAVPAALAARLPVASALAGHRAT
jgi:hypothetical protein